MTFTLLTVNDKPLPGMAATGVCAPDGVAHVFFPGGRTCLCGAVQVTPPSAAIPLPKFSAPLDVNGTQTRP